VRRDHRAPRSSAAEVRDVDEYVEPAVAERFHCERLDRDENRQNNTDLTQPLPAVVG
jgi:hypothetical protein